MNQHESESIELQEQLARGEITMKEFHSELNEIMQDIMAELHAIADAAADDAIYDEMSGGFTHPQLR
jgi:hypothetical protein